MKKAATLLAMLVCSAGLLVGCGDSYEVKDSTVFVEKDGAIISTDIESFDVNTYDESGLKEYVSEAIDEYTQKNGTDSVKLKNLTVEDGQAKLTLEYASVEDYSKFNEIEMFSGSLAEALAAGYSFGGEFYEIKDGTFTLCDASSFLTGDGYKVVIIKSNTNVHVKGTVKYTSCQNVAYVDNSTIAISNDNNPEEEIVVEETQATEEATEEAVDVMNPDPLSADEGSVGDEDLLLEEDTEIVFEFEERERPASRPSSSQNSNYTNVYTYIIYK